MGVMAMHLVHRIWMMMSMMMRLMHVLLRLHFGRIRGVFVRWREILDWPMLNRNSARVIKAHWHSLLRVTGRLGRERLRILPLFGTLQHDL